MEPVKLKYTVCYPDEKEIEYRNEILNEGEAIKLIQAFDFDSELVKPMDYYSPSLDFIRLDDRFRLILSGLGDGQLEAFYVMLIEPIADFNSDVFDEDNYSRTNSYAAEVSIEETYEIFNEFISQDYEKVTNKLIAEEEEEWLPDSKFEKMIARIGGLLLSLFFGFLTYISLQGPDPFAAITFIFGALCLFFVVGSIVYELKQHK